MASSLVDLDLHVLHQTAGAWLFWDGSKKDEDGDPLGVWVPKSVVEDNGDGTYTIPKNTAYEKGLI